MGEIINITDALRMKKSKSIAADHGVTGEAKKYIHALNSILKSDDEYASTWVKTTLEEAYQRVLDAQERKKARDTRQFRDEIREALRKIKWGEENMTECEKKLSSGTSKLGAPLAESTLKQIKSELRGWQKYLDKYKQELAQCTEDEIREAIEKEGEDKKEEMIEEYARNYERESIISFLKLCEKENKRYATKIMGGVQTHGRYRGQPLREDQIKKLKEQIAYKDEVMMIYREALKLKDRMKV